jgi:uncharacterized SAM-binding protein YcdF (DUF218 family)
LPQLVAFRGKDDSMMKRIVASLAVLLVICTVWMMTPRAGLLSGLTVHMRISPSDAIILLPGNYEERAPAAAKLFQEAYAPLVILANDGVFSGWSTQYNRNLYQIEWAEEALVKLGVPRDRIVKLPFYGSSTMFDALAARRYLIQSGLRKIIVVTSDYHTRRAFWTFRCAMSRYDSEICVYPARSSGMGNYALGLEYLKLGYYWLRYGVLGLLPEMHEAALDGKTR